MFKIAITYNVGNIIGQCCLEGVNFETELTLWPVPTIMVSQCILELKNSNKYISA